MEGLPGTVVRTVKFKNLILVMLLLINPGNTKEQAVNSKT